MRKGSVDSSATLLNRGSSARRRMELRGSALAFAAAFAALVSCNMWVSQCVASEFRSHLLLPGAGVEGELPTATPWPLEFAISFTTTSDRGTQEGFLAYDWGSKQQWIWHAAGAFECLDYGTEEECSLLFNPQGIFVIIPSQRRCWLDTPGVGSVPPDWVVQGQYVGVQEFEGAGLCRGFAFPPTDHVYWERVQDGRPCVFVFSVAFKTYTFKPDTLSLGTPNPGLFALPDFCT